MADYYDELVDVKIPRRLAIEFKNRADFVEVVRCEKCIHGEVSIISRTKDGKETWGCYCNVKNKVTDVDAYCSFGKKRGNENGNKQ
jgi:hypothetical protein